MKLNRFATKGALAGAFVLAGCATLTGGDLVRKGEATGTLVIENASGVGIDVVTLSRCSAMSYGLNRLGGSQSVIPHNSSMSFTLGAGCWDLMVGRTGTCNNQGCSWLQSPAQRFQIGAGDRQVVSYGQTL